MYICIINKCISFNESSTRYPYFFHLSQEVTLVAVVQVLKMDDGLILKRAWGAVTVTKEN